MFERRVLTCVVGALLGVTHISSLGAAADGTTVSGAITAGGSPPPPALAAPAQAPKILLDQPLRAVEYQLNRLTNDELVLVERKDDDVRYRPVYFALLTRRGVAAQFRDEALTALTTLDKATRSRVLLDALNKTPIDDPLTAEKLLGLLLAQPADILRKERDTFTQAIDAATTQPLALRGAYGALLTADGKSDDAWQLALKHQGHLVALLLSVRQLPTGATDLRAQLFQPIAALLATNPDVPTRTAALDALGSTRRDAATFELLARQVKPDTEDAPRAAAIASLQRIPESAWPPAAIEPLARAVVAVVAGIDPDKRTDESALDAIHFGETLTAKLADDARRAVRRDLRALGVQVVRIQTIPEKLAFDLRWFTVEAGKAVQIVLLNSDAMPHNLIVGKPGSLEAIGTAASAMPMPTDPEAKAFVPDSPAVLYSTRLVKEGETERLGFTAPKEPGEYVFVCTFPGHWVRMYGVMLVVEKLDAWEASPTVPTDPITKQPFTSKQP